MMMMMMIIIIIIIIMEKECKGRYNFSTITGLIVQYVSGF